jgi:hypothetical protein
VEGTHRRSLGERWFEYYMLLRLRFHLGVFPIVIYLSRGAGGLGKSRYREGAFDESTVTFTYWRIGIPDLPAESYLQSENPLAYGLAALMRPEALRRAELKVECLLRIARALVDEARTVLLTNCVETYLQLGEEQQQFDQLVEQPLYEEARRMHVGYFGEVEKGAATRHARDTALRLLRRRFGPVSDEVEARVQAITTQAEADALIDAIVDARSLADLGLTNET